MEDIQGYEPPRPNIDSVLCHGVEKCFAYDFCLGTIEAKTHQAAKPLNEASRWAFGFEYYPHAISELLSKLA